MLKDRGALKNVDINDIRIFPNAVYTARPSSVKMLFIYSENKDR